MAAIEGNDLVSAVARAVRASIPERELMIYKDKPRQNFKDCSIYIDVLNFEQQKEMRKRYGSTEFLDLRLHPQRDYALAQSWCRAMNLRVQDAVQEIDFHGSKLTCKTYESYYIESEQVQHIILVYKYKTIRLPTIRKPKIFMETLEVEETLKYGERKD